MVVGQAALGTNYHEHGWSEGLENSLLFLLPSHLLSSTAVFSGVLRQMRRWKMNGIGTLFPFLSGNGSETLPPCPSPPSFSLFPSKGALRAAHGLRRMEWRQIFFFLFPFFPLLFPCPARVFTRPSTGELQEAVRFFFHPPLPCSLASSTVDLDRR